MGKGAEKPKAKAKASSRGASPAPKSDNRPAKKSLKRAQSIYALTPHKKWLAPSLAFPFFTAVLLSTLMGLFLIDLSFEATRLGYTIVAVCLLIYRLVYYTYKQWFLYFIDLCYASTYALLASLWLCPSVECSKEWQLAIFTVAQGAVAGAVFPLQTPLALHHPEAFESFYLHVSPMWVCYAVRWRFFTIGTVPGVFELAVNALWKFYLPWFVPYFIFLLLQPSLPDCVAGLETLPDCQLRPGASHEERLKLKRGQYVKVAKENFMAVSAHAVLSFSGFLAAGMAYQYHSVQITWICCIMFTCIEAGYQFYGVSYDPSMPGNTILRGFVKMGLAWLILLASYMYEVRSGP